MSITLSVEGAVAEATILIRMIDKLDAKAAPCWWELADLSAEMVLGDGERAQGSKRLRTSEWAKPIGWTKEKGKQPGHVESGDHARPNRPRAAPGRGSSGSGTPEALGHFKGRRGEGEVERPASADCRASET